MIIPKHMQSPNMTKNDKKFIEAFVNESRQGMRQAPTFATVQEAIERAVEMAKSGKYRFPSVWKEPQDIGNKYAVVHSELRANAGNGGYTEEVDEQRIFDLANGIKRDEPDDIDEVE